MQEEFIKLLLIGDSGVGKSCILTRYCQDKFSAAFYNTIGVDFKTKQCLLDGTKCKMQIWDTAGQERFRTITSNYYKGANGILLVYDVTSKASFKDIDYWLSEVDSKGNESIVTVLVGNKCDQVGKREVSEDEAQMMAKSRNIEYIEVSALNASNVNLVFETIGKHILRKKLAGREKAILGQSKQSAKQRSQGPTTLSEARQKISSSCC